MVDTYVLVHFTYELFYQNSEFVYYVKYDPIMSICIFCHRACAYVDRVTSVNYYALVV
jgi:hypothetical protein